MSDFPDYYSILGVNDNASPEEIRNAYFSAARHMHPDVNPDPQVREHFLLVQQAYEILSDPEKRSEYNHKHGVKVHPSISVRVQYSRTEIPRLRENQLVYALIEYVSTADPDTSKQPPINLCLVIDRSTSMKGERMDMVKANVSNLLRRLSPNDVVSIIAFSDRAEVVLNQTRVKEFEKISERVSRITAGGGTELYQGLKTGFDLLRKYGDQNEVAHLFLLTDGHTYGDEEDCFALAEEASKCGIIISALGIGSEWNDTFLDRLAGMSGGNTTFVSSPGDLSKLLDRKLATIGLVYARGVMLEYSIPENVQLRYGIRLLPEVSPIVINSPMMLGNLQYGRRQMFLLEFLVPKVTDSDQIIRLLDGKLRMHIPVEHISTEFQLHLHRQITNNTSPELPPSEIIDAMSRLTLYRLQEKARLEVEEGNFAQATRHLQYLATHLLAQGDRELAHTVLKEAEHIQQSHRFSSEGDKKIKYGTRSLLLPASFGEPL